MQEPSQFDLEDLQTYFSEMGYPLEGLDEDIWGILSDESSPRAPDLVVLRPRQEEDSFSTWVVEKGWKSVLKPWRHRLKRSRIYGLKGYADGKLFRITHWITSITASLILSISIIVLYCIKSTWARLGVMTGFNLVITVCLMALTKARRVDVFAITAAYVIS